MPMLVGPNDKKAPQFLKKLTQRCDCHLSRLSPALLSPASPTVFPLHRRRTITAAACSPATTQPLSPRCARPHPPDYYCRLHRGQGTAHRGPCSCLPAAILLLHCDRTAGSCCAVLRSPACLPYFAESACCKHMFQIFQMFQRYVVNVSYRCCKVDRVCICCNSYTHILQVSIPNVTPIFQTYVASVFI
jgi:hypothetical protein